MTDKFKGKIILLKDYHDTKENFNRDKDYEIKENRYKQLNSMDHSNEIEDRVLGKSEKSQEAKCSCGHDHEHSHSNCTCDVKKHHHEHCSCGCSHCEQEISISEIIRIAVATAMFMLPLMSIFSNTQKIIFYLGAYIISGYPVIGEALRNLFRGEIFDENTLMTLASLGAIYLGEFPEASAVMIFYCAGELFQSFSVTKSRASIRELLNLKVKSANKIVDDEIINISPEKLMVNDTILIKPGERVPIDGIVIDGNTTVDTSSLTGESLPKKIKPQEVLLSGFINISSPVRLRVIRRYEDSTVSRIMELVENSTDNKAKTERFLTRFSKIYSPIVVALALLLIIVPTYLLQIGSFQLWLHRALVFLAASCPCALILSIPLCYFMGIGVASKNGVLIKGSNYLEGLSRVDTVVFDKTGTLTKGVFDISKINPSGNIKKEELLEILAHGEFYSNHPIAKSVLNNYKGKIEKNLLKDYVEIPGYGVKVKYKGETLVLGSIKLMKRLNISCIDDIKGTIVYIALGNRYLGKVVFDDIIREESKKVIKDLVKMKINNIIMLTGDKKQSAEIVGKTLGINKMYAELLPQNKVEMMERIITKKNSTVVFIGDGINDAPVLARADIGISMGNIGSDAAIEASDIVLLRDNLESFSYAIKVSKYTKKIIIENIILALGIKSVVLVLGAFGVAAMWEAVFADVGVTLLAVLNCMRIKSSTFKIK